LVSNGRTPTQYILYLAHNQKIHLYVHKSLPSDLYPEPIDPSLYIPTLFV